MFVSFGVQEPYIAVTDLKVKNNPKYSNTTKKLANNDTNRQYFIDSDIRTQVELQN